MTKRAPKKAAPGPTVTLADVTEGDTAVLESGASAEVGFRLGDSTFVRFSDNHEPRAINSLPSTTAVVSVMRRERVATMANGAVDDPVLKGRR